MKPTPTEIRLAKVIARKLAGRHFCRSQPCSSCTEWTVSAARAAIRFLESDADKFTCESCGRRLRNPSAWTDSEGVELCKRCAPTKTRK